MNNAELYNLWSASQSDDSGATTQAVLAYGCSSENSEVAATVVKRMASDASDFQHFCDMMSGEAPMATRLTVDEAAALQNGMFAAATWKGNGGRTWEGSSR